MTTNRLEAFSDGVIAILITIMVLELKVPHGAELSDLARLVPVLLAYVLSFIYLGIYWNNHHHMLHLTHRVSGGMLWANLHLLFWLSLVPFATSWMGENHFAPVPTALYGVVLLCCALAWTILQTVIVRHEGEGSKIRKAIGGDLKAKISLAAYLIAIPLAFVHQLISDVLYAFVAAIWLVPDKRFEAAFASKQEHAD